LIIESNKNPLFKTISSLCSSKGIKKEGLFLLSGEKIINEFLKNPNSEIVYEIKIPKLASITNATVIDFKKELFDEIDVLGTHFNILVLKTPIIGSVSDYKPCGLEVLAPLGDPGNLGSLIRSCDAFGVKRLLLSQEAANPFLPKCMKASAGSVLRVPMVNAGTLKSFADNKHIFALDMNGTPIDQCDFPKDMLLVIGEEGQGIADIPFKNKISIPTANVESLNAVAAANIALFYISRMLQSNK